MQRSQDVPHLRVLWTHNFDPAVPNSGVFMHTAAGALAEAGVKPDLLYLGNLRSPRNMAAAARLLRGHVRGYDLVHSQFGSASALVTAAAPSVPRVVTLRGSDWTPAAARSVKMRLHASTATGMTRLAMPRFDLVVSVSNRIAREVRTRHPKSRVVVLPSPIDLELFSPTPKSEARARLGLVDDGRKYVLFTALNSGAAHKRRELAEAAIAVARRYHPGLQILVASGRDHSEMPLLVSAADVAMCTSTSEGWPNSMKEALACNVPFVATDVSDLQEIADVEDSCEVVPDDPQQLGEAISRVLSLPAPRNLRGHVEDMRLDSFAHRLIQAYDQVFAARRDGPNREVRRQA